MEVIKKFLSVAPDAPGVYQMLDKDSNILYIGKAKSLYKRLYSYTRGNLISRTIIMLSKTCLVKVISTSSESEALLLEAKLVKEHQPPFNILLKDDKSYPYIKFTDQKIARVVKYRGKQKNDNSFGPFASIGAVNKTIDEIQKIFKLRNCSDHYFGARKRPCLQYQIKRCSAPCVGKISDTKYAESVREAKMFLNGKTNLLQNSLAERIKESSAKQDYETAIELRDKLREINIIQSKSSLQNSIGDADIIAIASCNSLYVINISIYRAGQNYGSKDYFFKSDLLLDEMLNNAIMQIYHVLPAPKKIYISNPINNHVVLEEALSTSNNRVRVILPPFKGDIELIAKAAYRNAELALTKKTQVSESQKQIFKEIQDFFKIPIEIKRIEVYDNSHNMGDYSFGGMIVASEDGLVRKDNRAYKIASSRDGSIGGDDYYMLEQVMRKRFKDNKMPIPELIIIDGGKGQLSVVEKTLKALNIESYIFAMAKGKDRNSGKEIFYSSHIPSFSMPRSHNVMLYLQMLRDKAHNNVIEAYRKKHQKAMKTSKLDDIEGIGDIKKMALLRHFGSIDAIKQASIIHISQVDGIGDKYAKIIYRFFNNV